MGFLVIQYQPSLHSNFQASKVIQWESQNKTKQNYFNNINYKPCSNFSPHVVPLSALSVSYLCSENTNGHVKLVPWSLCGRSRATALHCCNSFVCVVAPRPPMEWVGGALVQRAGSTFSRSESQSSLVDSGEIDGHTKEIRRAQKRWAGPF